MEQKNNETTMIHDFLLILKKAWPDDDNQFYEREELIYRDNLIPFCNKAKYDCISSTELQIIFDFVYNSISHLVDIIIRTGEVTDYVKECIHYILIFLDHIALNLNPRFVTQDFFIKIANYILTIPTSVDDLCLNEVLMDFYDSSDLLHNICHYMNSLNIGGIDETTISGFMKKARYTPQSRLFRFFLYGFNDQYFRMNYPAYADECTPRELYYGILYNYFKLTYNGEIYKVFINMCANVSDDIACLKNHDNPIYNFYLLSQDNCHLSLKDIYPQIGRLFHN